MVTVVVIVMAVPMTAGVMGVAVLVVPARLSAGMSAARAGDGDQPGDDRAEERQENDG
jgi:hypothetical protein